MNLSTVSEYRIKRIITYHLGIAFGIGSRLKRSGMR